MLYILIEKNDIICYTLRIPYITKPLEYKFTPTFVTQSVQLAFEDIITNIFFHCTTCTCTWYKLLTKCLYKDHTLDVLVITFCVTDMVSNGGIGTAEKCWYHKMTLNENSVPATYTTFNCCYVCVIRHVFVEQIQNKITFTFHALKK